MMIHPQQQLLYSSAVCSRSAARYCEQFVFSVILGDDVIGRCGSWNAFDLKLKIMNILLNCDVAKAGFHFITFCISSFMEHCNQMQFFLHISGLWRMLSHVNISVALSAGSMICASISYFVSNGIGPLVHIV